MSGSIWTYTQSTESNLLKETYGKHMDKQFNEANVIFGRMKKMDDFEGEVYAMPVEQSIGGGVSSGSLGRGSRNKNLRAELRPRKLYAVVTIDRESMKASTSDKGSFVRFLSYPVRVATRSFNRNLERQITLNDLSGLGRLATVEEVTGAGTTANPYVFTLPFNTVTETFEDGDLLHLNEDSDEVHCVEVVDVTIQVPGATAADTSTIPATPGSGLATISVVGQPSVAPSVGDEIFMQKSRGNELEGLQGILKATTGSYKNIPIRRRWIATQENAEGAPISTAILNKVITRLEKTASESPTMVLASFEQYNALLDLQEDQKTYNLPVRDKKYKETLSFSGIEFMVGSGPIPVMRSRFVPKDEIYILNDNHMYLKCRPGGFKWFDEDGTVFLREANEDALGARYGGYADFYCNPHFQAIVTNLAIPA